MVLGKHKKVIGISPDDPIITEAAKCRYISCIQFEQDDMKWLKETEDVKRRTIEKGTYAVFLHKGSHENIKNSYKWIVEKYFPKAAYLYRRGVAPYECYLNDPANTEKQALRTEIYIPVVPKVKETEDEKKHE